MTLPTLDVPEALAGIRAALALPDRGSDYIDPRTVASHGNCRYLPSDGFNCIVGEVLKAHGVEELTLVALDIESVTIDMHYTVELTPFITEPARKVLYAAQSRQDAGLTWGEALEEAEAVAANYTRQETAFV